jgi:hypothetical protein
MPGRTSDGSDEPGVIVGAPQVAAAGDGLAAALGEAVDGGLGDVVVPLGPDPQPIELMSARTASEPNRMDNGAIIPLLV